MASYNSDNPKTEHIYNAVAQWRKKSLENNNSVLSDRKSIWTEDFLKELLPYVQKKPDKSKEHKEFVGDTYIMEIGR